MTVMGILMLLCCLLLPNVDAILYKEFRIPVPFTLGQTKIGHRWSTAEYSLLNTGGGEGVEVITNEPFEQDTIKGQYTHKIFHLASKVPREIRILAPKGSLEIHEKSRNSFPVVKTVLSNPDYMKVGFHITIFSVYMENDDCTQDKIFDPSLVVDIPKFTTRDIVNIDIVNDLVSTGDYSEDSDPTKCRSEKLNLGPLNSDWKTEERRSCIYKLVETEFKWWGLQSSMESRIDKALRRLFHLFHRNMFCWADKWAALTIDDVLAYEVNMKQRLDEERQQGEVTGFSES